MADLFSYLKRPSTSAGLLQLGGTLLAAGQPMPYGANRGALLMQGLGQVPGVMQQAREGEMARRMMEMKLAEAEEMRMARSRLTGVGGPEGPGRPMAMDDPSYRHTLAAAYPSAAASLLAPPKPASPISPEGKLYYDYRRGFVPEKTYRDASAGGGDRTSLYKNLVNAGYTPGTPAFEEAMRAAINKPLVSMPKPVSETQAIVAEIERLREKGDPQSVALADRLDMKLTFGSKPPEAYVKARNAVTDAREGIATTYSLIQRGLANPLNPRDRARVRQSVNKARLAYADMLNRGANFTETEQAMVDSILGGDPNDVIQRAMRGDESYLELLQSAGEALERRGVELVRSYTTPRLGKYRYPWQPGPETGRTQAPQPVAGPTVFPTPRRRPRLSVGHVQDGYRYKGGPPGDPTSWEKIR